MQKTVTILGVLAAAAALTACGERPQTASGVKSDAAPYTGVGQSQYQQPGWKVGDKTSWEQQLKSRAQYGQNDYSRIATQ